MSVEVESNPFRPDGELSREAEDIIKNSTILRDKVIINDPSMRRPENGVPHSSENPLKVDSASQGNESAPLCEDSPIRTGEVVSGQVSFPVTEETAASADGAQPMLQVEHTLFSPCHLKDSFIRTFFRPSGKRCMTDSSAWFRFWALS
ncbi:hypothetical protein TSMEX_002436 [Taenia solium]|eukprot:TsM_000379400 transcript=TsM_000379400 gene=TsM_000379400